MAKIYEEVIVIKLSKLVKDDMEGTGTLAGAETIAALEQITQELVGDSVIVEIDRVS